LLSLDPEIADSIGRNSGSGGMALLKNLNAAIFIEAFLESIEM
jgi:hypothetical protein